MLQAGFSKIDITPRVGVQLCGFGPYLNRVSIGVRDRLWARAMALRLGAETRIVVSCDLVGVGLATTAEVRRRIGEATGLPGEIVLLHCTHTHSGPATRPGLTGWGEADPPYMELLPRRIARACLAALDDLAPARVSHACVPCEGMGLNREYDRDAPPLEEVLREDWRPAKPELTDTRCHVLRVERGGRLAGFLAYFGCHPVTCCQTTRYIHGDYAGVAMNLLEREHPGSVGLFLQGAQGDVNSCVVHKPEAEAMLALDVLASRFARSVRHGLAEAAPVETDVLRGTRREIAFPRERRSAAELREMIEAQRAILEAPDASDEDRKVRMAALCMITLPRLLARVEGGETVEPPSEVQGVRLGPLGLLAAPFEIMQAIKNEVVGEARAPIPLVMGISNDLLGYAPDRTKAAQGGYAAIQVPMMMLGELPFADIHGELVRALLALDAELFD